jgi:hypothetical protein
MNENGTIENDILVIGLRFMVSPNFITC